jgi:L,D-transpeptidase ErfK/SrfK
MQAVNSLVRRWSALLVATLLAGCQTMQRETAVPVPALPKPLATHEFTLNLARDDVIGAPQVIEARDEDTLSDIARRFNVGYEEIVSANPGVDPWLPKAGTPIVVPTQFVLPDAPRRGIVVNLAAMRLFYFPKPRKGEPQRVITHPLGIGRVEWKTPEGTTKVVAKKAAPAWIPTPSIHKEHAANGDPLPKVVPPGPDNPMGSHVLRLGWPAYAIHGTNKPPSIGLRGSHGCLRLYPEDIVNLFHEVPVGTPVTVVNQPQLFGWREEQLFFQAYPVLEDDKRNHAKRIDARIAAAIRRAKGRLSGHPGITVNRALLGEVVASPRALALPISSPDMTVTQYIANARRVENRLPLNATWDGDMSQQLTAADVMERAGAE